MITFVTPMMAECSTVCEANCTLDLKTSSTDCHSAQQTYSHLEEMSPFAALSYHATYQSVAISQQVNLQL